jgi:hypothetical protein
MLTIMWAEDVAILETVRPASKIGNKIIHMGEISSQLTAHQPAFCSTSTWRRWRGLADGASWGLTDKSISRHDRHRPQLLLVLIHILDNHFDQLCAQRLQRT